MRELLQEMGVKSKLEFATHTKFKSTVFEDSQSCIAMIKTPKITSQNKYLSLKYHFFKSHVGKEKGVEVEWVESAKQKADIFTNGLPEAQFQAIRKLLVGW